MKVQALRAGWVMRFGRWVGVAEHASAALHVREPGGFVVVVSAGVFCYHRDFPRISALVRNTIASTYALLMA